MVLLRNKNQASRARYFLRARRVQALTYHLAIKAAGLMTTFLIFHQHINVLELGVGALAVALDKY